MFLPAQQIQENNCSDQARVCTDKQSCFPHRRLWENLEELASLDLEKMTTEQVLKVLEKAMKAIADVKKVWTSLIRLFNQISNVIKVCD